MNARTSTIAVVIDTIGHTLGIEERARSFDESTELLDSIAELDSMAIVELIVALEDRFGIEIDEDDISGDVFETVGSLAGFVDDQQA